MSDQRAVISNPVLTGFNADPSIVRVGDDYYIATSTFEWFPGVQIHHSRDLVNWQLVSHALTRRSQLDMRGNEDSAGVWAPCLTYADGLFWLVYSNVRTLNNNFKDVTNYLVTAPSVQGPWSEPIVLNKKGFDASLYHDEDGRKYYLQQLWDHRPENHAFAGIIIQEYDHAQGKLVGPVTNIFRGTSLRVTEGPHLYKHDGYYHLMTAEGGTKWEHAITMARSKSLLGPYEVDPAGHLLTALFDEENPLQKVGHGSLVQTQNGEWYLAHLTGRPSKVRGKCMLGRETAIQKCTWVDGWLRLEHGDNRPRAEVPAPSLPPYETRSRNHHDTFDAPTLGVDWQTLREPADVSWLRLQGSCLELTGRESLVSRHDQSLIGRRVQAFESEATTRLEFAPTDFQHMAGLAAYYNTQQFAYLYLSYDPDRQCRVLRIAENDLDRYTEFVEDIVEVPNLPVILRGTIRTDELQFSYSLDGDHFIKVGPVLDSSKISDDHGGWQRGMRFTGAFWALACQDLAGDGVVAKFDWFDYREL